MGQKINPVSLRLQSTNRHFDNCWYSNYFYRNLIYKDILLQRYLNNFLKLFKLPTGRYSIHHLQKKTQVYNFFCFSKSTRLWRSKMFGLTKNKKKINRTRYFLKNKTKIKNRINSIKHKKFINTSFYTTINQQSINKIQKRITSFQNFQLWSALQKTTYNKNSIKKLKDLSRYLSLKSFKTSSFNNLLFNHTNFNKHQLLIQQIDQSNQYQIQIIRDKHRQLSKSFIKLPNSLSLNAKTNQMETNLLFLQNLFIFKAFNSLLKKKQKKSHFLQFFLKFEELKTELKTELNTELNTELKTIKHFQLATTNALKIDTNSKSTKGVYNTLNSKYNNYLESSLASLYQLELDLIPFKVKNDWQHASYLAEEIVYFLEKRIPFRRLKGKILKQLSQIDSIRGVRITCSGRVGGKSKKAQRSKTECLKYGQTSLQVFSSKIDFSIKTAFTSFGSVGVKVWICYN